MWILFSSCMSPLLCGLFLARDRQDKPHLQGMIENDTWEINCMPQICCFGYGSVPGCSLQEGRGDSQLNLQLTANL